MELFMKKKNLLILWIAFIIMVNLAFIMLLVVKSEVLGAVIGIMSAALFVFAIACSIKRSNEIKKANAVNRVKAQAKMAEIDELLAKK